jgi:hypothetical protein
MLWQQALATDTVAVPIAVGLSQLPPPKYSRSLSNPFTRVPDFDHLVHVARGLAAINKNFADRLADLMSRGRIHLHGINLQTKKHVKVYDTTVFYDDPQMEASCLLARLQSYYNGTQFHSPGE